MNVPFKLLNLFACLFDSLVFHIKLEKCIPSLSRHFFEFKTLVIVAQCNRCSDVSGSCSTTDSVNVSGKLNWQFKVDNGFDFFDIKSSGSKICGQHVLVLSLFEIEKSLNPLSLAEVSVQFTGAQT